MSKSIGLILARPSGPKKARHDSIIAPAQTKFKCVGKGGFGIAFLSKSIQGSTKNTFVIKLALDRSDREAQDCAISREANLYSAYPRDTRDAQYPLPRLRSVLGGGLYSFATFVLNTGTTARWLCIEPLRDWPQDILKNSGILFSRELRADAEGRGVLLKVLGAILWMDERGIVHNDLKIQHIFSRIDGCIVLIDFGSAQRSDVTYEVQSSQRKAMDVTPSSAVSYDMPSIAAGDTLRTIGEPDGRPGTEGYRPKNAVYYWEARKMVNSYQLGMIILHIICAHLEGKAIEYFAYRIAALSSAKRFLDEVLASIQGERNRTVHRPSCATFRARNAVGKVAAALTAHEFFGEDIVLLCYGLLSGQIAKAADAYSSSFVRKYIPSDMGWFELVCARGVVVLPKNGVKNPVVIVWDKHRGFDVLTLFDFIEGECVAHYMGRSRLRTNASAKASAHDFSFHTIVEDGHNSIDGTPDTEITVEVMVEHCAIGPLIRSSRKFPSVRSPSAANISNPQGVKGESRKRTIVLPPRRTEFRAVSMHGLRTTRSGSSLAWDYN
jgi:hypothetical protein